jgi:hypothetical protein
MYKLKKNLESYLRVNLLGPGPSSYKKIIYRAAVSQRLGNTALEHCGLFRSQVVLVAASAAVGIVDLMIAI